MSIESDFTLEVEVDEEIKSINIIFYNKYNILS